MMFYSGQKVICVDAKPRLSYGTPLEEGRVYTVLRTQDCGCAGCAKAPGVLLVEVEPPGFCCSFWHTRFRPAVDRKTGISVFAVKQLEDA